MTFKALLVSQDDEAAAVLTPVLSGFSLGVQGCGYTEAIRELTEQKFDAVLVDFDEPEKATLVLQNAYLGSPGSSAVTVALLRDHTKVRSAIGAGANLVLYKPISAEQAKAALLAATALIKRERRRCLRVPVQVPVELRADNGLDVEGILLDLSEVGMEVMSSQPLCPSSSLMVHFALPDGSGLVEAHTEVAWASLNGQTGMRFTGLGENSRAALFNWVAANSKKLPPEEPEILARCKLTDLSLGGCYVETESPFPERSAVILRLNAAGLVATGLEVQVLGVVRVMHPGFGMGIEFLSTTGSERDQVAAFIKFLASHPQLSPELSIMPRGLISGMDQAGSEHKAQAEFEDPLLDLLHGHESLSQEQFLHELRGQRGRAASA
jgi:CheY-like chemotaxis protein